MILLQRVAAAILAALYLIWAAAAAAQNADGAFVTQSDGGVTFEQQGQGQQPVLPFAKLFPGTKVTMPAGGKLQILYLDGGRQETWAGLAAFTIGAKESTNVSAGKAAEVKMLPPFLVSVLTKSREVIDDIKVRQGMVRVRSLTTHRKIVKLKKQYKEMRAHTTEDDITPEIFLLTAFDGLKAYSQMRAPLNEILKRQPDNAEAKKLHDQFLEVLEAGEAGLNTDEAKP